MLILYLTQQVLVGTPNKISDVTTYTKASENVNSRRLSIDHAKKRLQDPNLSKELQQYYSERVRLGNL